MRGEESTDFDATVIALYDAATSMSKWPVFLERMCELFEAPVSQVVYYDFELEKLTFRMQRGLDGFPPEMHKRYLELSPQDEYVRAMQKFPGKPLTNAMHTDRQSFESTEIFREVYGPSGISAFGRAIAVHLEPSAFVSLGRRSTDPPFDDGHCMLLGRLVPHLRRAFTLHRRLALLDINQGEVLASLDALPLGIVLTDADGRIRQANRTAREIAERRDGLLFTGDFIAAGRQADSAQLQQAVRNAVSGALDGGVAPAQAVSIARNNGSGDYPVVVSAVWSNPRQLGLGHLDHPLAVLFVTDPDRPQEAPAELLQRLFGLTGAEAAVAEKLVAGHSLPQVAKMLGVSHNTARTHLNRIFSKTGTARQSELVKKIMDTPIWTAVQQTGST